MAFFVRPSHPGHRRYVIPVTIALSFAILSLNMFILLCAQGIHEAVELRDGDSKKYGGKGVLKAVANVDTIINAKLKGVDVTDQKKVDRIMIEADGTENKSKLGANAILAVSLAVAKAGAAASKVPLYRHFAHLAGRDNVVMPVPFANVINGGVHASNALAMQEFMVSLRAVRGLSLSHRLGVDLYSSSQPRRSTCVTKHCRWFQSALSRFRSPFR
jgi:enolase